MKKIIVTSLILIFVSSVFAQIDSPQPPYKKNSGFPPVTLLLPDSVSYFSKNDLPKKKPVMLMMFSPMCEHCHHETAELVENIDKFKDIQIVMVTSMPFDSMMTFREKFKLAQYKNIVVAQDTHYFLFSFYMSHQLPFLAFYNRKKELISVFEGGLSMEKVLKEFEK
jgi:thiol-disulfide isomerase/thioredoxin